MTHRLTATALLLSLCLPACSPLRGDNEALFVGGETYYLDSNLGFSWAYPAGWERSAGTTRRSVRWITPVPGEAEEEIRAEVTSLPASQAAGGYRTLMKNFTLGHPNFTLTAENEIDLGDGTPAREILGHTPARSFLVGFVTSRRHAFTLVFSLPPEHFNRYLPLFREMTSSFRALE